MFKYPFALIMAIAFTKNPIQGQTITFYWADPKEGFTGLVFTQEYMPESYRDLGLLFKNAIYSSLNTEVNEVK